MDTLIQLSKRLEQNDRNRARLARAQWRILGGRMKEARTSKGVGLRELARRMGISAPFLGDMEKGARRYTPERVRSALSVLANVKFRDTAGT